MEQGSGTPWGPARTVGEIAPGIHVVSTARHGGIHLDTEHAKQIPDDVRLASFLKNATWFEEDYDWCIPFVLFEAEILAGNDETAKTVIKNGVHVASMKRNHPGNLILSLRSTMKEAVHIATGIQDLTFSIGSDGVWMNTSGGGKHTSINLSNYAKRCKSHINDGLLNWCIQMDATHRSNNA